MELKYDLPKGWSFEPLLDVVQIYNKSLLPIDNEVYNYVSLENIESNTGRLIDFKPTIGKKIKSNKVAFLKGMVLYGKLRPYLNKVWVSEFDGIATTEILPFYNNKEKLHPAYLAYFFRSPAFLSIVDLNTSGSRMPRATSKFFSDVAKIPLPPLPEQNRIVAKLDALFERIDKAVALLEENIRKTEELMEAVLGEVFDKGQVSLATACIFNPKKSEIKNLPDDLIVSFVPMADLNENQMYFNPRQEKALKEVYSGYTYFQDDDVLLAKVTPCFENGKAGIAKDLKNGIGFGSSEFHVLRPKEGVLSEWIYYAVSTRHLKEEGMKSFTGSSGLQRVPGKFLESYMIQLPTKKEQEGIVNRINTLFAYVKNLQITQSQKLQSLKSLKSSLLDQAFRGEL